MCQWIAHNMWHVLTEYKHFMDSPGIAAWRLMLWVLDPACDWIDAPHCKDSFQ
jgi:hypothetical protein